MDFFNSTKINAVKIKLIPISTFGVAACQENTKLMHFSFQGGQPTSEV